MTLFVWPCAGLALLGQIDEKFVEVVDVMEPLASGSQDRAFISRGYDATSHFETTVRPGPARQLPAAHHGLAAFCKILTRAREDMECPRRAAWRFIFDLREGMPPVRDVAQAGSVMHSHWQCL